MLIEGRDRESVTIIALYDSKHQGYIAQATIFWENSGDFLALLSSSLQPSIELTILSLLHISAMVLSYLIHLKAFSPSVYKGNKHKEPTTYHR